MNGVGRGTEARGYVGLRCRVEDPVRTHVTQEHDERIQVAQLGLMEDQPRQDMPYVIERASPAH
jgi:hypothetical protein